ncbi:hypothetical protein I4U23_017198 [Adineta vaga]|nr:hypothetical protein I4U23_017198 [Adineta vaga]
MSMNLVNKFRDLIKNLNLYDENQKLSLIDQLLSTKIFICLLLFSLTIIILFTSFTAQIHIVTVDSPSEDFFKQLSMKYSQTLSCLCQQTSINQGEIVSFHPQYHPICSSQFINQTFLSSLTDINVSEYWPIDYRLLVSSHIEFLQIFCRMTKEKVTDVLQEFSSRYLITSQILSYNAFQTQMSTIVKQLQQNTMAKHKHINDFIWFSIFYNGLYSGLRSNLNMVIQSVNKSISPIKYANGLNNCDCKRNDTCIYPAYILNVVERIVPNDGSSALFILPNISVNLNLKQRIRKIQRNLRQQILVYNMFPLSNDIKDGIYATRFYILCLILGLVILIFYSSISTQIRSITIQKPSFEIYKQLFEQYPSTLTCPCSHLSIKYSSIINITTTFHQICLSDFIKDDMWLLYSMNLKGSYSGYDFRVSGISPFRILQKLCLLSNETITNELTVFNNLELFTIQVLTDEVFNEQIYSIIDQFRQQTIASFYDLFQIVQTSIQVNQFAILENIDTDTALLEGTDYVRVIFDFINVYENNCSCALNGLCQRSLGFYCWDSPCPENAIANRFIVPDWFISCSTIDSLLISALTCFYNSSCIQMLIDGFPLGNSNNRIDPRAANVTPLNPMIQSRFTPLTKLDKIISELFIEQWIHSISFKKYFQECSPNECIYTYEENFNISYIITTIAGIIGGLSVALRILVPLSVKLIRRIFRSCYTSNEQNITGRFSIFIIQIRNKFQQMNFYRHHKRTNQTITTHLETNNDIVLIKQQRIATRVYIILFLISIGIILIFLTFNSQINSITISSPSLSTFEELYNKYSSTLICPCSNIAISYSTFVSIQPLTYYQICSSDLISLDFITSLWGMETREEYAFNYDRKILSGLFRVLSAFCKLTKNTIEQNMKVFSTKQIITLKTLIRDSFESQIDSIIDNFIVQTLAQFQWIHHYIIDMFHGNQLVHKFNLNWKLFLSNSEMNYAVRTVPVWFNESGKSCLCTTSSSQCFRSLLETNEYIIQIPGIIFGCLPIDGLRQSTLGCFYDSTCFNEVVDFFNMNDFRNGHNQSLPSDFNLNSSVTIGKLIDELFVKTWQNSSNYSNYYLSCSPLSCQYSYVTRNSIIYIITKFLGLYGGLTVGLKLFVWHGLNTYWKIRQYVIDRHQQNQVVPVT